MVTGSNGIHDAEALLNAQDAMPDDEFNQPYARRRQILVDFGLISEVDPKTEIPLQLQAKLKAVSRPQSNLDAAKCVHDPRLVEYLESAWTEWVELGEDRCETLFGIHTSNANCTVPSLIPANSTFRDSLQEPGRSVHSKTNYYHTDKDTPIFAGLREALCWDLSAVLASVERVSWPTIPDVRPVLVYCLVNHPGHHATRSSIGGYCYLNAAAICAKQLQLRYGDSGLQKVAILDVDYHAGNGTFSIFYDDPTVFVVSIHADPDLDYPFNTGYAHQKGSGIGEGHTLNIPLKKGTTWLTGAPSEEAGESYSDALDRALRAVASAKPQALVISLGLDTFCDDPVQSPAAGISLTLDDFERVGMTIAHAMPDTPMLVVQEGGYVVEVAGRAAGNFLRGLSGQSQCASANLT